MKKFLFMFVAVLVAATSFAENAPQDSISTFQLGVESIVAGNYEEGIDYLNQEVRKDPTNGRAIFWIASARFELGQYDKAMLAANHAIRYIPKKDVKYASYARFVRGDIYWELEDVKAAMKDYAAAIKMWPTNLEYYERRAECYYLLDDLEASNNDYKCMIAIDPDNVIGLMGLGRNLLDQEKYEAALEYFTLVIQKDPNNSLGYSYRALCLVELDQYEEALDDILKALDIDLDQRAYLLLVGKYTTEEQLEMVKTKLQSLREAESHDIKWTYLTGVIMEEYDCFAEAIIHYKNAKKNDPTALVNDRIAICYARLGDFVSAIQYADLEIAADSTNVNKCLYRAYLYGEIGDYAKAMADLDRFIEQNPEHSTAYYHRAWYKKYTGQYESAVEDFSVAILLEPNEASYYDGRARAYLSLDKQEEAKADFEKILTIDVEPTGSTSAPSAYHFLGNDSLAIDFALRDLAIDSTNYYNVACVYSLANDLENAILYLRKAFETGFVMLHHLSVDQDMDNIRHTPEFQALVEEYTHKIQASWPTNDLEPEEYTLPNSMHGYPSWAGPIL